MSKPVFLFAFANDADQSLSLKEEERQIRDIFAPLHDRGQLEFISLGATTLDDIYKTFNRFHNRIHAFHFAGHSNHSFLNLEDRKARASSLSKLIGMQKHLKLVCLNGCANQPQVKILMEDGTKVVIATRVPIEDKKALSFSEAFYDAFAKGKSIEESFDTATSKLMNNHPDLQFEKVRGFGRQSEAQKEEPFSWNLNSVDDKDLEWTIPSGKENLPNEGDKNFIEDIQLLSPDVNKSLVELTFEGISEYKKDFEPIWNVYKASKSPDLFFTLQNLVLDNLPSSLSIQLRDLFTPEGRTKARLRLKEIYEVYLTVIRLLSAISLANLWEKVREIGVDAFIIRDEYKRELKQFLEIGAKEAESFDYLWLISSINRILEENDINPFVSEFEHFHSNLGKYESVYEAYRYFEQEIRPKLIRNQVDINELEELCEKGEYHLGRLLQKCAFLGVYQIVTIKEIDVYNPGRIGKTKYTHKKAILKGRDYATIDDAPIEKGAITNNYAILVTKDFLGESEMLNLTPFVIDENAFKLREDKLPKIYFFKGWTDEQDLCYEHAEMQGGNFIVRKEVEIKKYKESLKDLYEQFKQFRKDLNI